MSQIEMSQADREQLLALATAVLTEPFEKGESILKLLSTQYTTFTRDLTAASVSACADKLPPTYSHMALGKALVLPVFTALEKHRLNMLSVLIEKPLLAAEEQIKQSDPESSEYLNASRRVQWCKDNPNPLSPPQP